MSQHLDITPAVSTETQNVRTLAAAQAATDWYVNVKITNSTKWDLSLSSRILGAAGTIEKEPDSKISANSTGSGGKYDAPSGPYGSSALVCYNSPSSDWRFAWSFVMPYIGSNSCKARIISSSTNVDQNLFNSMDTSSDTAVSQTMTVDGTSYKFTISCSIGGGTTPTLNCYVNVSSA